MFLISCVDSCIQSAGEGVWGNISSLFLVILRWTPFSPGLSNLTWSPMCLNELFMEKNNHLFFSPHSFIFLTSVREGTKRCMTACIISSFLLLFPCSESTRVRSFSVSIWEIVMKVPCDRFAVQILILQLLLFSLCFHFIFTWILFVLCCIKWGFVPEVCSVCCSPT